jgi:hypothetical protein
MSWFGSKNDEAVRLYNEIIEMLLVIQRRNTLLKETFDDLQQRIKALEERRKEGVH